ncbi:MAG TPA: FIST N-terminal domain-containing protein [Gaiellaceae bacterium]|jgi:small ligand-binding sensory domain FIST
MTRIAAGLSTAGSAEDAAREAAAEASKGLAAAPADLAFAFLSTAHLDGAEEAVDAVRRELAPRHLLACVAEGIVGAGHEVEDGPAIAVWAASLPGAEIEPFHAQTVEAGGGVGIVGVPDLDGASLVTLLADPFTFPVSGFLDRLNEEEPRVPLVGGLAVGGDEEGAQSLVAGEEAHAGGAVGAVLRNVPVRTVVSQGCAPIGRDAVVTHAEGNIVYELAGQPAIDRLREEIEALPTERQLLATRGLLAGLVIDENQPSYARGDYLMRGLLGADEESGAIAVGERVRVGQTLRFHVRDAASADEDLRAALHEAVAGVRPAGALLFTCNGRGRSMFPMADHDARAVSEALDGGVAGYFCGGEIGPVGGQAFLHGYTATLAVFLDDSA